MHNESFTTSPNIKTAHAFTTRHGGVSSGVYATLNLGLSHGDDPGCLKENYAIISRALNIPNGSFVYSKQTHGTHIRLVTSADSCQPIYPSTYEADGMLTMDSGLALVVFTADCIPILLHDPTCGVIGAVHAGWRGTVAGIAGAAVKKMTQEFGCDPANIKAAIGPGVSKCCYETGADVASAMRAALGASAETCLEPFGEKYKTDLKEANRLQLLRAGLCDIHVSSECTSCSNHKYWSHRKTDGPRGSQAAIIMLE